MNPYSNYAAIYDRIGQSRFGTTLAQTTLDWLSRHDDQIDSALDLATGTGAAALVFAREGLTTHAIDRSPEMIAKAEANANSAEQAIAFSQQDMQSFTLPAQVSLVVSFFDSVNYLIEDDDVQAMFRSVATALKPGGWFVFDVNTIARFDRAWNDSTDIAYQDDETFVIYRSSFDPKTALSPLVLTVFERMGELWRRWDETHVERGYRLADIEAWLRAASLEPISVEQLNERTLLLEGPATERSDRAVFFARKRADGSEPIE